MKFENKNAPWSNDQNYILIIKSLSIRQFKKICLWIDSNFGSSWLNFKFHETIILSADFKRHLLNNQFDINNLTILYNNHVKSVHNAHTSLVKVTLKSDDYFKLRFDNDIFFGKDYAKKNQRYLQKLIAEKILIAKIAYINDIPVGLIEIISTPSQTMKEIYFIFVLPDYRNQSVASQLIASSSKSLFAVVSKDDTPIDFYIKIGFKLFSEWVEVSKKI